MKCDCDCFNCTIPQSKCSGGGKSPKTATCGIKYNTMVDGKKGQTMADAAFAKGRKVGR